MSPIDLKMMIIFKKKDKSDAFKDVFWFLLFVLILFPIT